MIISNIVPCPVLEVGAPPHAPYEVRMFHVAYVVIPDPKGLPISMVWVQVSHLLTP